MLTMADGPVANLPAGMNAYGGYVNDSGIGETWPGVQAFAARQGAIAFSITTNGSPAMCADVENGAMSSWTGYEYGYCAVSNVNSLIAQYGRPYRLLTAHYNPAIGEHICSPACTPGLVTTADGTQWTDNGGVWDASLLNDNFFGTPPPPLQEKIMQSPVFSFRGGQLDIVQVSIGALWHKWNNGSGWKNEQVGAGLASFTGQPQVFVSGGAAWISVEDTNGAVWLFEQGPTGPWNNSRLS